MAFYNKEGPWSCPRKSGGRGTGSGGARRPDHAASRRAAVSTPAPLPPFTPADREDFMIGRPACSFRSGALRPVDRLRDAKQRPASKPAEHRDTDQRAPGDRPGPDLWSSQGNRVIRGNLLVIPIVDGILDVQSLYLQAGDRETARADRVIVSLETRLAMAETFADALAAVLGGRRPQAATAAPRPPSRSRAGRGPAGILSPAAIRRRKRSEWGCSSLPLGPRSGCGAGDLAGYAGRSRNWARSW